jgi:hypothetical protein
VQFTGRADFRDTQFTGEASFEDAKFTAEAIFMGAKFTDLADFVSSRFTGEASFRDAQFTFRNAYFTDQPDFERARVASTAGPVSVWPLGWTTRPAKPGNGEDPTFLYLTRVKEAKPPGT